MGAGRYEERGGQGSRRRGESEDQEEEEHTEEEKVARGCSLPGIVTMLHVDGDTVPSEHVSRSPI